jgi:hypothetical protein
MLSPSVARGLQQACRIGDSMAMPVPHRKKHIHINMLVCFSKEIDANPQGRTSPAGVSLMGRIASTR